MLPVLIIPFVWHKKVVRKPKTQCYRCAKPKGTGKMYKCVKCKIATYCCRKCQKAHWHEHEDQCPGMEKGGEGKLAETFVYSMLEGKYSAQLSLEGKYRATHVRNTFQIHELCAQDERNVLEYAGVRVSPGDILVFSNRTRFVGYVNLRLAVQP
jgi:hypothetical protein